MGKLRSLLRALRPFGRHRTESDAAYDRVVDARTERIVNGKVMGATGGVTDFDRDQTRPKY